MALGGFKRKAQSAAAEQQRLRRAEERRIDLMTFASNAEPEEEQEKEPAEVEDDVQVEEQAEKQAGGAGLAPKGLTKGGPSQGGKTPAGHSKGVAAKQQRRTSVAVGGSGSGGLSSKSPGHRGARAGSSWKKKVLELEQSGIAEYRPQGGGDPMMVTAVVCGDGLAGADGAELTEGVSYASRSKNGAQKTFFRFDPKWMTLYSSRDCVAGVLEAFHIVPDYVSHGGAAVQSCRQVPGRSAEE